MNRLVLRTYALVLLAALLAAGGSALVVEGSTSAHERASVTSAITHGQARLVHALENGEDPRQLLQGVSSFVGPCLALIPNDRLPLGADERALLERGEAVRHEEGGATYVYQAVPSLDAAIEYELLWTDLSVLHASFFTFLGPTDAPDHPLRQTTSFSLDELTALEQARIRWRPIIQRSGLLGLYHRVVFTAPRTGRVLASPYRLDVLRARRGLFVAVGLWFTVFGIAIALRPLRRELAALGRAAAAVREGDLGARALPHATSSAVTEVAEQFDAMAERIEGLLAEQEELFRSVNHELRTPIARMLFNLDLLEEGSEEEKQALLADLRSTTAEMRVLTDELLAFARLGHASPPIDADEVDLAELIEDIAARWPSITLQTVGGPVLVRGDSRLLFRALDNLASNADRYAEGAHIRLEHTPDAVHVLVEDLGPGIPVEARERLFKPFARGEHSRSRETGGVGLGLAIVRRVARAHGGSVTVEANQPRGVRFRMRLPVRPAPNTPA